MEALPELRTDRLLLRPYRCGDFDAYHALWSDSEVTRFVGGVPFTREQSWSRFLRHAGLWQFLGYGGFAVWDRASGEHLGEAGFHDLKRAITPSLDGTLETGWVFLPRAHGRGIAFEAVNAALHWAADAHPGRRITCFIDDGNERSLRLARKLGYVEFQRSTYQGKPIVMFERRSAPET